MADPHHDQWLNTALGLQLPPRAASGSGGATTKLNLDLGGIKRDMESVFDYLRDHRLTRFGGSVMLDSNAYSVDAATQLVIQKLHLKMAPETVSAWIRDRSDRAPDMLTLDQGARKAAVAGAPRRRNTS